LDASGGTTVNKGQSQVAFDAPRKAEWAILFSIAAAVALLHLATNGRYGFHRDELQFLSMRAILIGASLLIRP